MQQAQLDCVATGRSFSAECGIGSGKTRGLVECIHMIALQRPGPKYRTLVMCDTSVHLRSFFQPIAEEVLPELGWEWCADPLKFYWRHPNGHTAWLRPYKLKAGESAQKSSVQGFNATAVVIDEGQDCDPRIRQLVSTRARIKGPNGEPPLFLLSGLPTWNAWWMQWGEEVQAGTDEVAGRPDAWQLLRTSSHINLANLSDDFIDRQKLDLPPDQFDALIRGLPQAPGGLVCRSWSRDEWDPRPFKGGNVLHGWKHNDSMSTRLCVDFGLQWPAVLFIAYDPKLKVDVVFDQIVPSGRTDEQELIALILQRAWPRRYERSRPSKDHILLNAGSGDPMGTVATDKRGVDAIQQMLWPPGAGGVGLPIKHTFDPVMRHIPSGIRRLLRRILDHDGHRRLVADLAFWKRDIANVRGRGFAQAVTRLTYIEGKNVYGKGKKAAELDHIMDALRYDAINWHWYQTTDYDRRALQTFAGDIPAPRAAGLARGGGGARAIRAGGH